MNPIDYDAILERIREFRAGTEAKAEQPEPDLDVRELGARVNGKPHKGDELATIADRMFRY